MFQVYIKSEPCAEGDPAVEFCSAEPDQETLPFSVVMVKQEPIDEEFAVKTEEVNIFDDHFASSDDTVETAVDSILPDPTPASKNKSLPENSVTQSPLFEITLLQNNVPEQILPTPTPILKSEASEMQISPLSNSVTNQPKTIILEKSLQKSQGTQTQGQEKPLPAIPVIIPLNPSFLEAPLVNPQTLTHPAMPATVKIPQISGFPERSLLEPETQSNTQTTVKIPPKPDFPEIPILNSQTTKTQSLPRVANLPPKKRNSNKKLNPDDYDHFGSFVALSLRSIKQKKYKDKLMRIIRNAIKGVCQEDLSSYTPETHLFKDT